MGFIEAIKSGFSNYVNFSGRSRRSAYWFWFLFVIILQIITYTLDGVINPDSVATAVGGGSASISVAAGPVTFIAMLAVLLPGIAVSIRRLHDTDRSGWWLLIVLVPLVGAILLIVWYCTEGTRGPNRFGADPKA
jgi:uncharacterized membrane protein YhaH (DUF805 family)